MQQKSYRTWTRRGGLALLVAAVVFGSASAWIEREVRGRIFPEAEVPRREVALVLGAGVFADGRLSDVLADRVETAAALYRAGKVRKLLMSGDNRRRGYDEPTAMMRHAEGLGVPAKDIVLDYAGFHTYDSCYRARHVFQLRSAIVVTQRFHVGRAVFTATHLGLDAVGVPADRRRYKRAAYYALREQGSRLWALLQAGLWRPRPRLLGPPVKVV